MISARNQLKGTITGIQEGAVNGIVKLAIAGNNTVSSTISLEAIHSLGLKTGGTAYAVVKATEVMIADEKCRISARNQFAGTISSIEPGAVNCIVKLDIAPDAGITSTITMEACRDLGLKVGGKAYAVIKATSVMIAVD